MNELIRMEGITKKFGEHLIIPTLDLTINDGEFVTLLARILPICRLINAMSTWYSRTMPCSPI